MKRHSLLHPCRNKIFILSFQYSIMIIFIFTAGEVERPGNGFCFLPDRADDWFVLIWASPITFPSFVAILNHFFLFCSFTEIKETEMLWWIKLRHLYWCLELQRLEKQLCHLFCTRKKFMAGRGTRISSISFSPYLVLLAFWHIFINSSTVWKEEKPLWCFLFVLFFYYKVTTSIFLLYFITGLEIFFLWL